MKKLKENRFNIDFFEFSFLVETCIPPKPIARAMFWSDVIDKYYHVLTEEEREKLYEWINKNPSFQYSLKNNNEDCLVFNARYNPENQYKVKTLYKNKEEIIDCFKFNDKYHTSINTSINEDYMLLAVNKLSNLTK